MVPDPWLKSHRRRQILLAAMVPLLMPARIAASAETGRGLVSLDWAAAEMLGVLGHPPIALADIDTFREWLPYSPLPGKTLDIGSRVEPNMELLAVLKPDAILVSNWQKNQMQLLWRIAPVWPVRIIGSKDDPLRKAISELTALGERLGEQRRAERYIVEFENELALRRERLSARNLPPVHVGVLHENGSQLFLYGPGSWVHSLLLALGLENALSRPTSAFGNALVDLAALADRPDALFLYLDQGARTRRAERALRDSTLWQRLAIVQAGRVRRIPSFYPLGGLPSIRYAAGLIETAVVANESARDG